MSDSTYMLDLSNRLMNIPASYGVDQRDCDRLNLIARRLDATAMYFSWQVENDAPVINVDEHPRTIRRTGRALHYLYCTDVMRSGVVVSETRVVLFDEDHNDVKVLPLKTLTVVVPPRSKGDADVRRQD